MSDGGGAVGGERVWGGAVLNLSACEGKTLATLDNVSHE